MRRELASLPIRITMPAFLRSRRWRLFLAVALLAAILANPLQLTAERTALQTALIDAPPPHTPPAPAAQPRPKHPAPPAWDIEITVRDGDTLSSILQRLNIGVSLPALLRHDATPSLHQLHPKQILRLRQDAQGLSHLAHQTDPVTEIHYRRAPDGTYTAERVKLPVELRRRTVQHTIERNLFRAGLAAGLSSAKILELANIFHWDIDFALGIRKGDLFKLVWNERWAHGRHILDGPILVAEFVNRGRTYRALRYVNPDGQARYHAPDGQPMRKLFLRTPTDFTRISSYFNPHRLHPILKVVRPHRGIDYAAPTGTAVYAAGDGTITYRGWLGNYGRVIFIQHGSRYTTVYAHLSKYAPGLRSGSRVTQGQRIGRVGQTGMATGPHLHYEFRVDGVHRNPMTVSLPPSTPLPRAEQAEFRRQARPLLDALSLPADPPAATAAAP